MPERWEQVRHWRERAVELQQAADGMTVAAARDGLEQAARGYERMADDLERVLKEHGIRPDPKDA